MMPMYLTTPSGERYPYDGDNNPAAIREIYRQAQERAGWSDEETTQALNENLARLGWWHPGADWLPEEATFHVSDDPERIRDEVVRYGRQAGKSIAEIKEFLDETKNNRGWKQEVTTDYGFTDIQGREIQIPWHLSPQDRFDYVSKVLQSSESSIKVRPIGYPMPIEFPIETSHEEVEEKLRGLVPNYSGYERISLYDDEVEPSKVSRFARSAVDAAWNFPTMLKSQGLALNYMLYEVGEKHPLHEAMVAGEEMLFGTEFLKKQEEIIQKDREEDRKYFKEVTGKSMQEAANPYREGSIEYHGYQHTQSGLQLGLAALVSAVMGPQAGLGVMGTLAGTQRAASRLTTDEGVSKLQSILEGLATGTINVVGDKLPVMAVLGRQKSYLGRIARTAFANTFGEEFIQESFMSILDKATIDKDMTWGDFLKRAAAGQLSALGSGVVVGTVAHPLVKHFKGTPDDLPRRNVGVDISEQTPMGVLTGEVFKISPIDAEHLMNLSLDLRKRGYTADEISEMPYHKAVEAADISKELAAYPELHRPLTGDDEADTYKLAYRSKDKMSGDVKYESFPEDPRQIDPSKWGKLSPKEFIERWMEAREFSKNRVPYYNSEVEFLKDLTSPKNNPTDLGHAATPHLFESFPRQVARIEQANGTDKISKMFVEPVRMAESRGIEHRTNIMKSIKAKVDSLKLKAEDFRDIGIYAMAQQKNGPETLNAQFGDGWYEKNVAPRFDPSDSRFDKRLPEMYNHFRDHYDDLFDRLNKARVLMGKEPLDKTENYFTFMRAASRIREGRHVEDRILTTKELETGETGVSGENFALMDKRALEKVTSGEMSFEKERTKTTDPFERFNSYAIFERYVQGATDAIHKGPIVSKLKTLAAAGVNEKTMPNFRVNLLNYLNRQIGINHDMFFYDEGHKNILTYLNKHRDKLSGRTFVGSRQMEIKNEAWRNAMMRVKNNSSLSVLSYAPKSVIIQIGALANTYTDIGLKATYNGLVKALDGDEYAKARDRSQALKSRLPEDVLQSKYADVMKKLEAGAGKKMLAGYEAFQSHGVKWLTDMDAFTATAAFLAAEDRFRLDNYNKPEYKNNPTKLNADAVRFADEHVIKAHASISDVDLSRGQKTDYGKFMGALQTFTINNWQFLTQDVIGMGMKKTPENFKKVTRFLIATAATGVLFEDFLGVDSPMPQPVRAGFEALMEGKDVYEALREFMLEAGMHVPFIGGSKFGNVTGFTMDTLGDIASHAGTYYGTGKAIAAGTGFPQAQRIMKTAKQFAEGDDLFKIYETWFGETLFPTGPARMPQQPKKLQPLPKQKIGFQ